MTTWQEDQGVAAPARESGLDCERLRLRLAIADAVAAAKSALELDVSGGDHWAIPVASIKVTLERIAEHEASGVRDDVWASAYDEFVETLKEKLAGVLRAGEQTLAKDERGAWYSDIKNAEVLADQLGNNVP